MRRYRLAALALLALLVPALASSARAQATLPASPWAAGEVATLAEPWKMSWWYAEVERGYQPRVEVEGEGTASAYCPQLAPPEPETCMVYAWGAWVRVRVDGQVIAWRPASRSWLPVVARGP